DYSCQVYDSSANVLF
nr:immunoglobulin light chain junction region [Macaca mulatta]MOV69934.1 immunoglobulin light chain junction region [Macaca mulatta]